MSIFISSCTNIKVYLLYRESCEHALEIYVKIYGHKTPSVAAVLASLGNNWKHTGDKDKAITTYQKALTIQEEIYGLNHLEVSHHSVINLHY